MNSRCESRASLLQRDRSKPDLTINFENIRFNKNKNLKDDDINLTSSDLERPHKRQSRTLSRQLIFHPMKNPINLTC